ncbi:MAG: hypothetical protein IIX57_05415 [Lachnospiraceae bacterium]|nr:hypothetical protein [Lachnospiraceae bacterium]
MPYCPKCDMEFVEGITKCSDCGGPLFESKEAAEEMYKRAQAQYNEQMKKQYEMMMAEQMKQEALAKEAAAEGKVAQPRRASSGTFVDKGQKYEDMASSASAFLIVGVVTTAALILSITGLINLPFYGVMKLIIYGMLAFMAIGSFVVAVSSKKSAAVLKTEISSEKDQTKEIIEWFVESYTPDDIDRRILFTESGLSPEEMSLRRFEWIQELLIIGKDLPDQAYVDMLCDEIYSRLFEN